MDEALIILGAEYFQRHARQEEESLGCLSPQGESEDDSVHEEEVSISGEGQRDDRQDMQETDSSYGGG